MIDSEIFLACIIQGLVIGVSSEDFCCQFFCDAWKNCFSLEIHANEAAYYISFQVFL